MVINKPALANDVSKISFFAQEKRHNKYKERENVFALKGIILPPCSYFYLIMMVMSYAHTYRLG